MAVVHNKKFGDCKCFVQYDNIGFNIVVCDMCKRRAEDVLYGCSRKD